MDAVMSAVRRCAGSRSRHDGRGDEVDDEGDDGNIFEDKRKKPIKKKATKKKLFPFIQKKKKKNSSISRPEINYCNFDFDVRNSTISFLNKLNLESYTEKQIERLIFNFTVRKLNSEQKDSDFDYDYSEETNLFKSSYIETVRHCLGCILSNNLKMFVDELKKDIFGWESNIFQLEKEKQRKEIDKIKNPALVTENPDHPCPKCKCTRSFGVKKQLRGGDEGESKLFTCEQCSYRWRING
jgi:DNA-directed RNA polymerase subunit M/transcription elongation factor TFIIS